MAIIDADAHVIETEQTWNFMLEEDRRFTPEVLISKKNGIHFWRVDDRVIANSNLGLNVPEDARDLTDVSARLAHMDALKIDIQVLYPTLFLRPVTARAEVELALYRGYNRWLAHIWQLGNNRLRWIVLPPLRSMDKAIEEITSPKPAALAASSCAVTRANGCSPILRCFRSIKKPNGSTCRSASTPAPAVLITTINMARMFSRASSCRRWARLTI